MDKVRSYWELGKHDGNTLGISWEHTAVFVYLCSFAIFGLGLWHGP
jgi:hypothetical protein